MFTFERTNEKSDTTSPSSLIHLTMAPLSKCCLFLYDLIVLGNDSHSRARGEYKVETVQCTILFLNLKGFDYIEIHNSETTL